MSAGSIGIAGAPSRIQISDVTGANIAGVTKTGDVQALNRGLDQSGTVQSSRVAPDGSAQLNADIILAAMLIEMRIQTKLLSAICQGLIDRDDPEQDRKDADIAHLFDSYNLM